MTWVNPTALNYVTSSFSLSRRHPVTGVVQPHTGTDYRAPTGTPLLAVTGGTVVRSTYDADRAGHYVRIDVGDGVWVGYSHLSRRSVVVGQKVKPGQVIGLAGDTGSATAAHLHFEVCVGGVKVDPVSYLRARVDVTPVASPGGGSAPTPSAPSVTQPTPLTPEEYVMATRAEVQTDLTAIIRAELAAAARPAAAFVLNGTAAVYLDFGAFRRWASGAQLKAHGLADKVVAISAQDPFWRVPIAGAVGEVYRMRTASGVLANGGAVWVVADGRRRWLDRAAYVELGEPLITDLGATSSVWLLPVLGALPPAA